MYNFLSKSKLLNEIKDDSLRTEVINCFSKYSMLIEPHMEIFTEFTDHAQEHIEFVVKTAEELIPEYTLKLLNDKDLFILLLSILYHDIGMHINKESLNRMINNNDVHRTVFNFKEGDVKKVWSDYCQEIKKYAFETLYLIFENNVSKEEVETEDKCLNNRYVVLDFVRRKHHIISHHIATNGFPLLNEDINFSDRNYSIYHDLSGLVARSHGVDIRQMYHILKSQFHDDWKTPHGIHIIYHMIILRIADYIHITSDRVNPYKLRKIQFKSERSKIETEKHISTYESHRLYDSPKTLFFTSSPQNSKVFFEMDTLINQIQSELDTSWGILGEVYGHSSLELSLRRVDSNIKYQDWLEKQNYVTEKIDFQMDHRIISLLVKPLYGSNPSYGIRELIQNSTDACRILNNKVTDYIPEIRVKFYEENRSYYLSVDDNGSGMDLDIIKNYFLKIGVSFKNSNQWKKDSNESTIRSGRFGIGILSSFLLGDEIEITTKRNKSLLDHNSDSIVYNFKTKMHSKYINIVKMENKDIESGTIIIIKLNELATNALKNGKLIIKEWYLNDDIKIYYEDLVNSDIISNEPKLIALDDKQEQLWNRINDVSNFKEIWWSKEYKIEKLNWHYEFEKISSEVKEELTPNLICNGIIIPEGYDKAILDSIIKEWPTVYVKDTNDVLDLDLSRYKLNSPLPFLDKLREETYQYFIYMLLTLEFDNKSKNISNFNPGGIYKQQKIVFYKDGYTILHPYFLNNIQKKVVRVYSSSEIDIPSVIHNMSDERGYIFENTHKNAYYFKSELVNRNSSGDFDIGSTKFIIANTSIFNTHMDAYAANSVKFNQNIRDIFNSYKKGVVKGNTVIDFTYNRDHLGYYNKIIDCLGLEENSLKIVIENELNYYTDMSKSIFHRYFNEKLLIPYDLEERNELFGKIFSDLQVKFSKELES